MSEIEVGDFVILKQGYIGTVENINDFREPSMKYAVDIQKRDLVFIGDNDIVKHSKQPIDLIEDKDIVEIELSEEFVEKKDKKKLIQIGDIYTKETLQKDIDNGIITRILTILPYNQYMANCYKVGGEDE